MPTQMYNDKTMGLALRTRRTCTLCLVEPFTQGHVATPSPWSAGPTYYHPSTFSSTFKVQLRCPLLQEAFSQPSPHVPNLR